MKNMHEFALFLNRAFRGILKGAFVVSPAEGYMLHHEKFNLFYEMKNGNRVQLYNYKDNTYRNLYTFPLYEAADVLHKLLKDKYEDGTLLEALQNETFRGFK